MKQKIQMRRAKHMLAIWLNPHDKQSLRDAIYTAKQCWPLTSQRILRSWVKELSKNPDRYEFTGMANATLHVEDHFTPEECNAIETEVNKLKDADSYDRHYIVRSIIQHKWVYGLSTELSISEGIKGYYGAPLKYRPQTPKLKGI